MKVRAQVTQVVIAEGHPELHWCGATRYEAGRVDVLLPTEVVEALCRVLPDEGQSLLPTITEVGTSEHWLWVGAEAVARAVETRERQPKVWASLGGRLALVVSFCRVSTALPPLTMDGRVQSTKPSSPAT